jgi:hypothetical protein
MLARQRGVAQRVDRCAPSRLETIQCHSTESTAEEIKVLRRLCCDSGLRTRVVMNVELLGFVIAGRARAMTLLLRKPWAIVELAHYLNPT